MRSHRSNKKGIIKKHTLEYHQDQPGQPEFKMWPIRATRTIVERLVWESSLISKQDQEVLMNSKTEFGRGKLIRFEPQIIRT